MDASTIHTIQAIGICAVVCVIYYGYRSYGVVMSNVKEHLLTKHGFVIACIWMLILGGMYGAVGAVKGAVKGGVMDARPAMAQKK